MSFILSLRRHRLLSWLISSVVLIVLIAVISPQQLGVTLYKLSLISLAAVLGYHLDRGLFPYASPGSYLQTDWKTSPPCEDADNPEYPVVKGYEKVFAAVLVRRAIIVAAVCLAVAMGL